MYDIGFGFREHRHGIAVKVLHAERAARLFQLRPVEVANPNKVAQLESGDMREMNPCDLPAAYNPYSQWLNLFQKSPPQEVKF